jgi:hypothetical protein
VDISRAWESIRESLRALTTESLGYYVLKQHKPWFDEVLKIIRSKESGKIASVVEHKPKNWS